MNGHVTDRLVKNEWFGAVGGKDQRMASSAQGCAEDTMSVGLRGAEVLSLTICMRSLRDMRCLGVTWAGSVK